MKKIFLPCPRCGEQPHSYSNEDDFAWCECPRCRIAAAGSYIMSEAATNWNLMAGWSSEDETKN